MASGQDRCPLCTCFNPLSKLSGKQSNNKSCCNLEGVISGAFLYAAMHQGARMNWQPILFFFLRLTRPGINRSRSRISGTCRCIQTQDELMGILQANTPAREPGPIEGGPAQGSAESRGRAETRGRQPSPTAAARTSWAGSATPTSTTSRRSCPRRWTR
jgi:hypothetical protein